MSDQSQKFSLKNKYLLITLAVFVIYLLSFQYKFLDPFVIGTWWAPSPGGDYYSVPRSFINLLYEQSIFTTEYFPFGDHATRYFYHPLLSVVLGSWLSIFPAIVSFYVFVAVSFGIVIYCGYILNEILNQDGKEYLLLGCSVATYLMLWNGQMHVFIMLSVSLILSGFHHQKRGNQKIANLRIMIGILVSLFSKPIILLSIPYFLILPQNRRIAIKSLIIYIFISVVFLLDTSLNPKGDNIIHWQNIIWQSTVADRNPGVFSISWIIVKFFELKKLPAGLHYFLKLPVLISLLPLIKYKKINFDNNFNYCLLGFILTTISYFLSYTVVWEYHYASLLPVIVFMLWSEMFKNKKLIKFSLFIISIPLLLQGHEIYVYNFDHIILAKMVKVTAVLILYIQVLLEIEKQRLKVNRWVSIGKDKKEEEK